MAERRYDIDWLRMGAMGAVFLFHCARFFDGGGWHLKNPEESVVATLFVGFLDLWIMPLFFLLSGAGSWYALRSRGPGTYLVDRVKRLLVPLYVTGVLLFIPPQYFFEIVTNEGFRGTLGEAYRLFFTRIFSGVDFGSPLFIRVFYGHLWFLQVLFLVSLATLPLLLSLRSERGARLISRLADACDRKGGIFIFLIPLAVVRTGLTHLMPGEHTWEDFLTFAVFFLIGYVMVADRRFSEGFVRHRWLLLVLGVACFGGEGFFVFGLRYNYANLYHPGGETFSVPYVIFQIMMSLAAMSWVFFMLGVGARSLNVKSRVLSYGNEAVLPFYIFHQTVILCVGWFVISWKVGMWLKYAVISTASFAIIAVLYELVVRRVNVARFLFGMRPK